MRPCCDQTMVSILKLPSGSAWNHICPGRCYPYLASLRLSAIFPQGRTRCSRPLITIAHSTGASPGSHWRPYLCFLDWLCLCSQAFETGTQGQPRPRGGVGERGQVSFSPSATLDIACNDRNIHQLHPDGNGRLCLVKSLRQLMGTIRRPGSKENDEPRSATTIPLLVHDMDQQR